MLIVFLLLKGFLSMASHWLMQIMYIFEFFSAGTKMCRICISQRDAIERKPLVPTDCVIFLFRFQHSKAFVITTWRSGSTFLSAYLNAHPGSFNHVEPLNYLKVSRINENQDSRADKAIDVIKNFINCKYDYAKGRSDKIRLIPSKNNSCVKIQIFWEGHKSLKKTSYC